MNLNVKIFLVRCAPSLNTRISNVVVAQLDASEQRRRFSSGPALSACCKIPLQINVAIPQDVTVNKTCGNDQSQTSK